MTRAYTAYASAYQPDRVHVAAFRRRERAPITADFTAVVPEGVTIEAATWRTTAPWPLVMADAAIDGTKTRVMADFQQAGCAALKATVTLSDGSVHNVVFALEVSDCPFFGEPVAPAQGPQELTVTV